MLLKRLLDRYSCLFSRVEVGPSRVPRGTPAGTWSQSEKQLSLSVTLFHLLRKKSIIQLATQGLIPRLNNFATNVV